MGNEGGATTPERDAAFVVTGRPQAVVAVSPEADRVARLLERPSSPTNPRYDNTALPFISDVIGRAEHGQTVEMPYEDFTQGVDAARTYINAAQAITDATPKKKNAAAFLVGLRRRFPGFGGIGFPDSNASATVVTTTDKSIPEENIPEVVFQAGAEFETFATQQLHLAINIPQGQTDRSGQPLTAEIIQAKLEATLRRMLRPKDRAITKFTRTIDVRNWKKLARLIREGKVSHTLVKVDQDFEVRPIPLHATPNEPIAEEAARSELESSS